MNFDEYFEMYFSKILILKNYNSWLLFIFEYLSFDFKKLNKFNFNSKISEINSYDMKYDEYFETVEVQTSTWFFN